MDNSEKIIRVVIYIRVSTVEQAKEGYSIEAQREKLINYCKARGWFIVDILVDPGHSGATLARPAIELLVSNINKYDIVLVYKLDRLSRSQRDTLHLIEEIFLPNGVDFVSMQESFDTSTSFGRAMIGILSVFAQLERETIRDRIMMGRSERARQGLYHGGKLTPIGYEKGENGQLVINDYEAMQVREAFKLYLEGNGAEVIAAKLHDKGFTYNYGNGNGDWKSPNSVRRVLSNDIYIGTITFADIVTKEAHPPIIDMDTWNRAQARRRFQSENLAGGFTHNYLLSGFLYCGECGARYAVRDEGNRKNYVCYTRAGNVKRMKRADRCENKIYRVELLDAMVDSEIRRLIFEPDYLKNLLSIEKPVKVEDQTTIIQKQVDELDTQISKLMDLYLYDKMPVQSITERVNEIQNKKSALQAQLIAQDSASEAQKPDEKDIVALLHDVSLVWELAEAHEKREVLNTLLHGIDVYSDRINYRWKFT